jgi:hypothetical protein
MGGNLGVDICICGFENGRPRSLTKSWLRLDVTAYLTDVLRKLPAILPTNMVAIRSLLPDQWANAHPDHIHASRDEELKTDNARRNKRRAKHRRAIVQ